MSEELKTYLLNMNIAYNDLENLIKNYHASNGKKGLLTFFLNNNDSIKKYITNLSIGTNLNSEEENEIAFKETYNKHVKFMNDFNNLY